MNPDLRAIEAVLLGEPYDPSNLSPEAASVILPLVRRVVQERDDGQHEINLFRDALEDAYLTLAAEQGKPDGAPTGWRWQIAERKRGCRREWLTGRWIKPHPEGGMLAAHLEYLGPGAWRWSTPRNDRAKGEEPTARAAMLTADKALFESRRAACLAKARQLQTDGAIFYPANGTHQQTPAIMIDRLSDPDLTEAVLAVYEDLLFNQKEVKP